MKKTTLSLLTTAALSALLLAGCTTANAAASTSAAAPQAVAPQTAAPQTGEAAAAASAPVAAPASQPTTGIAGSADPNSGYITEEAAKAAALEHAGLSEADLQTVRVKLDYDDGRALYDVEFLRQQDTGISEYDYEVDATTGEIVAYDYDAENLSGASSSTGTPVTAEEAKQIALTHAGVAESDTRSMELETDRDHGRTVYEFSWKVGFTEYDYEIDADTGEIISYSKEQD